MTLAKYNMGKICLLIYGKYRKDIVQKLTSLFGDNGDVFNEVIGELEKISAFNILHSYITCFSEHLESEDKYGRLSMWRGYGKGTGIALVLKKIYSVLIMIL